MSKEMREIERRPLRLEVELQVDLHARTQLAGRWVVDRQPAPGATYTTSAASPASLKSTVQLHKLGNYHCNNRVYDIQAGRWLSPDQASSPFFNLFSYARHAVLQATDPTGLDTWTENTTAIGGLHRRICVDTYEDGDCTKKTGKYCISFGADDKDKGCGGGGTVYEDNTDPVTEEKQRHVTSCNEDKEILKWLKAQVLSKDTFWAIGYNCRNYSDDAFDKFIKATKVWRYEDNENGAWPIVGETKRLRILKEEHDIELKKATTADEAKKIIDDYGNGFPDRLAKVQKDRQEDTDDYIKANPKLTRSLDDAVNQHEVIKESVD